MSDFTVEISSENDKKVISLDVDEMNICVYQETGNGSMPAFEITCDAPGGKVIGTLRTKVEFVAEQEEPDGIIELEENLPTGTMEAYSNRYGE